MFLYLDYSRYIYYFSKPWGCYVCKCVCNYIKFYECFLNLEAVCVSVCLSGYHYSRTTGYEAAYERYQQLRCYKGKKINVAILLKRLRSRDMA